MSIDPAITVEPAQRPRLRIPNHLAIIMDGNGRWAKRRGKRRTEGHLQGVKTLRNVVQLCISYGVKYLTVYSFSTENWTRPKEEISFIFNLLRRFVASDLQTLMRNNVRVRIIGIRDGLEPSLVRLIDDVEAKTAGNTGLVLMVAFNYGSKGEIVEATRRIARDVAAGRLAPEAITEETITAALYTAGAPDPDVILRTSGEQRISNFLLWQAAYSEFIFVDEYWPDFDEAGFIRVLEAFALRDRRYGDIEAKPS
jgi:undecaprenyl diphosphate synthase